MASKLLSEAPAPGHQNTVLQSHGLPPHLWKNSWGSLRGEGQWRVDLRPGEQDLKADCARPRLSRLRSIPLRWAARSPLLRGGAAGDLELPLRAALVGAGFKPAPPIDNLGAGDIIASKHRVRRLLKDGKSAPTGIMRATGAR